MSSAQEPAPSVGGGARSTASPIEKAIREFDEAFVKAYNQADPAVLAALYDEDAEVFEADGARYEGRKLIEQSYRDTFEAHQGAKLILQADSIRPLTPDVVKEEGRSIITLASKATAERFYTAIQVKRNGRWLIASVREEAVPRVPPGERLKELEWMIGEWVDSGSESETRVACRWSSDGNYLLRDFTVKRGGKVVMEVAQRVGWDPVARIFRSWEFDTEGGFGEATWSHDGNRWLIKQTGVRPEGVTASATRILAPIRSDLVRWIQTDRVLGGEAIPGEETSVLTKLPPAPRLGVEPAKPAQTPANDRERRP